MKVSAAVVLVLVVCLASQSEAGWVSRTFKKVGRGIGKVATTTIRNKAVQEVSKLVGRFGVPAVGHVLGKRSVTLPFLGPISGVNPGQVINALNSVCSAFNNAQGPKGLSFGDVQTAFGISDGNKDKSLNSAEFDMFENTVEAVKHCWQLIQSTGK